MSAHDPRDLNDLLFVKDLADVDRRAKRFIRDAGFTGFVYAFANDGNWRETGWTPHMNGYSDAWLQTYFKSGYAAVDPIPAHCFVEDRFRPLIWSSAYKSKTQLAFAEDALGHGVGAGLTFPIRARGGRLGAFSLALSSATADAEEHVVEQQAWAGLLATYIHDAFQRLAPDCRVGYSVAPVLSRRELQCLQLRAIGKTRHQIADRLHVTEATVKFHFRNIQQKFGLPGHQCLARAVALGLVHP